MKIEIKHRWSLAVLFTAEIPDDTEPEFRMRAALRLAVASGSDLRGSNLSGSDLRGSNLSGSDLRGSNLSDSDLRGSDLRGSNLSDSDLRDSNLSGSDLRGSNLSGSDLRGSDLSGSNLSGSDLRGSNLSGSDLRDSNLSGSDLRDSNLSGSDLRGSNLSGSDLSGSNLSGSDLSGSNLSGSDLTPIRDDFWAVLSAAPKEVVGLRAALVEGRVNGSTYEGECACLVGTIANIRKAGINDLGALKPNSSRPAEVFFLSIKRGDTPDTNQFSALAVRWTDEWLVNMREAFGGVAA